MSRGGWSSEIEARLNEMKAKESELNSREEELRRMAVMLRAKEDALMERETSLMMRELMLALSNSKAQTPEPRRRRFLNFFNRNKISEPSDFSHRVTVKTEIAMDAGVTDEARTLQSALETPLTRLKVIIPPKPQPPPTFHRSRSKPSKKSPTSSKSIWYDGEARSCSVDKVSAASNKESVLAPLVFKGINSPSIHDGCSAASVISKLGTVQLPSSGSSGSAKKIDKFFKMFHFGSSGSSTSTLVPESARKTETVPVLLPRLVKTFPGRIKAPDEAAASEDMVKKPSSADAVLRSCDSSKRCNENEMTLPSVLNRPMTLNIKNELEKSAHFNKRKELLSSTSTEDDGEFNFMHLNNIANHANKMSKTSGKREKVKLLATIDGSTVMVNGQLTPISTESPFLADFLSMHAIKASFKVLTPNATPPSVGKSSNGSSSSSIVNLDLGAKPNSK